MDTYVASGSTSEDIAEAKRKECQEYVQHYEKLKSERWIWEAHWQDCFDFIVPRKNDVITTRPQGDKRNFDLFDTTAILSNQLLSGALHGMLTNPATKFFDLVMGDPRLDEDTSVKAWLQEVGDRMFTVLNNSNFQTEIHEIYIDMGAIGTSCLYIGEHPEKIVHFGARTMKEVFIDENNLGLIDTVYRLFKWKPRQVVQEFGEENLPPWVVEQYQKNCTDDWDILHCVHPTKDDGEKGKIFPYESKYILKDKNIYLSEGGFKEFPYAVPRWTKTTGEKYGRGPGMDMLPDIKMVNKMMETVIQGAQKTVNPPMMVTDDGVIGRVRLVPGGLTVVRAGEPPIRPLIVDARVDFGYQAVEDVRKRIRAGFYVDQFQMTQGPQKTATEVMQMMEQNARLMGPVLGRQHFEFLAPVISRVFPIMARRGLIPPAPQAIQGKKFNVRYSSLLARSQRMNDGQNFARALSVATPLIQIDPTSADVINADEGVRHIFDVYGTPANLMNDKRDIEARRKARADAQAQAVKQQQEMHQAQTVGTMAPGIAQMQNANTQSQQGK